MEDFLTLFQHYEADPQTPEERHTKRMALEEPLFRVLKERYFSLLKSKFQSYKAPPTTSNTAVCIFEGRRHPNLEFLIYNAAYFAPHAKILFFCAQDTVQWIQDFLGPQGSEIELRPVFFGGEDRVKGRLEYNTFLKSKDLYDSIEQEYLLFLETDCYIRRPVPFDLWASYDFCACPASWDPEAYVGGASFRKNSVMKALCASYNSPEWAHDLWTDTGTKAIGCKRPPFEEALEWFTESCIYEDPVVIHQWWTFLSKGSDTDEILESLLTLKV
jgi:hypothetical protein